METFKMNDPKNFSIQLLLKEMCSFLMDVCEHLPENLRSHAAMLIKKTNEVTDSNFKSEYYMDMNPQVYATPGTPVATVKKKNMISPCSDYVDTYTNCDSEYDTPKMCKDPGIPLDSITADEECPYMKMSYAEVKNKLRIHVGILRQRQKRLCINGMRKNYAILKDNWLLLYMSDKDFYPTDCINVSKCKLKTDSTKDKTDKSFELHGEITFVFRAESVKEKRQWLTALGEYKCNSTEDVSEKKSLPQNRELPSIPKRAVSKCVSTSAEYAFPSEVVMHRMSSSEYARVEVPCQNPPEQEYSDAITVTANYYEPSTYETIGIVTSTKYRQNISTLLKNYKPLS